VVRQRDPDRQARPTEDALPAGPLAVDERRPLDDPAPISRVRDPGEPLGVVKVNTIRGGDALVLNDADQE
jgi:hypothetical protein